jgi:AraC-like DNA-binding protein
MQRDPPINDAAFTYYERLRRVRTYVHENLSDHVSLSDAAAVACLSRSHFSSFFRKSVGIPFMRWVQYIRIVEATRLFREKDRSVWDVACAVGFRSRRTFERSFKRWIGMAPCRYRIAHRPTLDRAAQPTSAVVATLEQNAAYGRREGIERAPPRVDYSV